MHENPELLEEENNG
ncbi:hypothetical protein ACSVJ3_05820 [Enterococcus faecalis]